MCDNPDFRQFCLLLSRVVPNIAKMVPLCENQKQLTEWERIPIKQR